MLNRQSFRLVAGFSVLCVAVPILFGLGSLILNGGTTHEWIMASLGVAGIAGLASTIFLP